MQKTGGAEGRRFELLREIVFAGGMVAALMTPAPAFSENVRPPLRYGEVPEIRQVKPKKPVHIKLHRNARGEYSWDLTGDNTDEIIKVDARLRKLLKNGASGR